jgi:hypothetical protein
MYVKNVCVLIDNHPRARRIGDALLSGIACMRWIPTILNTLDESKQFDLVVGYGWCHRDTFEYYRRKGSKYIYIDLGYWNRKLYRSDYNGFHKCILNNRHPTKYFRKRPRDSRRITLDAPVIQPWSSTNKGKHIVLAGMSAKGALSLGLQPMEWERRTVDKLRRTTKRTIIYRPKPSWRGFTPIDGTYLSLDTQPIFDILQNAHALVTYYSNASFDALAAGVPIYTVEGPAKVASIDRIENIENAEEYKTIDRKQLFNDISYCHFIKDEISSGYMFSQFMADGLI